MALGYRDRPLTGKPLTGLPQPRVADPFPTVHTEIDDHPALAGTLLRMLQDQREDLANRLVKGQPQTFDEYRNLVGKVEGLDIAIAACKAANDKLRA